MPDNIRVLDCRVDELQANLNMLTGDYVFASWNWYALGDERRVSVVMVRVVAAPVALVPGFDPRGSRRN